MKFNSQQERKEFVKSSFFFIMLALVPIALFSLPRLLMPLTVSFILYLMVRPLVPYLKKLGLGENLANFLVVLGILLTIVYPLLNIVPTIIQESDRVQEHIVSAEKFLSERYLFIKEKVKDISGHDLDDSFAKNYIGQAREVVTSFVFKLPKVLASAVEWVFLVPLFVFFLLKDGKRFFKHSLQMAPNHLFERIYYLTHQFNKQLGDYIFAKFVEAAILSAIVIIGLLLLDIKYALLLGLIAGATNIVPYLGPILGAVPALIVVGAEYGVGNELWFVGILYLCANAFDLAIVFPILVSKIVNLHPVVVVVSVILGSQYLGIVGMIISIPVATALKLVFVEVYKDLYINRSN
jgi:putative permease